MKLRWWERLVLAAAVALTLLMVGLLIWITAANAATLEFGATNARPARNATLTDLDGRARRFWLVRHAFVAAGEVYLVDIRRGPAEVAAYSVDEDIYVAARRVGWVQAHPSDREAAVELCADVFHEDGHRAGLHHTATGVMAQIPAAPWECVVWARDRAQAATGRRRGL